MGFQTSQYEFQTFFFMFRDIVPYFSVFFVIALLRDIILPPLDRPTAPHPTTDPLTYRLPLISQYFEYYTLIFLKDHIGPCKAIRESTNVQKLFNSKQS